MGEGFFAPCVTRLSRSLDDGRLEHHSAFGIADEDEVFGGRDLEVIEFIQKTLRNVGVKGISAGRGGV